MAVPFEVRIGERRMERGTGFEPAHPRVEALVHSLFYVTPATGITMKSTQIFHLNLFGAPVLYGMRQDCQKNFAKTSKNNIMRISIFYTHIYGFLSLFAD